MIRLILWKKFVKKIWKPPKQKLTKILRDEISRKNFGTEFTFIRSHYQNFNTGRYSIWRKVILSKKTFMVCNLNDFRINNIPLTDVDYFVFSDAASFVRQGLSPYLRSVQSIPKAKADFKPKFLTQPNCIVWLSLWRIVSIGWISNLTPSHLMLFGKIKDWTHTSLNLVLTGVVVYTKN